ncbi:protein kinase domain-containing protein [Vibrio sp. TRT 17S01]|uniref:protein kinase domain-containing protein n=1 Tax=Vibrio sp. TRT 17S01 TaxID=3418505 RepID=UPI003CED11B3
MTLTITTNTSQRDRIVHLLRRSGYQLHEFITKHSVKASHQNYGCVVIKIAFSQAKKQQLLQEAQFLTQHRAESWPELLDYHSSQGIDWVALPFCGERPTQKNISNIYQLEKQVATILTSIHNIGYIHGDIKPENLLVNDQQQVTLIDFGSLVPIGAAYQSHQGLTASPKYSSQAQLTGTGLAKPIDDFIALARTLATLTTPSLLPSCYQMLLLKDTGSK